MYLYDDDKIDTPTTIMAEQMHKILGYLFAYHNNTSPDAMHEITRDMLSRENCILGPEFALKVEAFRSRDNTCAEVVFISDFDHTITTFESTGCHSVIVEHTDSGFKSDFNSFVSGPWPSQELECVITRWQQSHRMIIDRANLTTERFEMSMTTSNIKIRRGVKELFQRLHLYSVPTIVASCGFENVIARALENAGVDTSRVSIDAHSLVFHPENGDLVDILPESPIHHMSKCTLHERHPDITGIEKDKRVYAIVVGDSPGDFEMMRGHSNCTFIHVGFARNADKAQKILANNWCDMIIVGDNNSGFAIINDICELLNIFEQE
jgi:2-hydroxy-3-keto-5-methylthiopentenyl-1-phosphate phosphatase